MRTIQPGRVQITAFDFHLSLRPFANPELLREEFRFLVNPRAYGATIAAAKAIPAGGLQIRPLRPAELRLGRRFSHNQFWPRFRQALPDAGAGYGGSFLPLLCTPLAPPPRFQAAGFRAQARGRAWLWPFGWSSQVTVVLEHPTSLLKVAEVMAGLEHGRPFIVAGTEPFGLTKFFSWLGRRVTAELYPPDGERTSRLEISRSYVLSLEKLQDKPDTIFWMAEYSPLPEGEQQLLHAALSGAEVPLPPQDQGFTITTFPRAGFGLTYFERPQEREGWRTLLLLHEASASAVTMRCMAENVAMLSLVAQALLRVASFDPAAEGIGEDFVRPVIEGAKQVLLRLHTHYGSPFARALENHATMKALRQAAAKQAT